MNITKIFIGTYYKDINYFLDDLKMDGIEINNLDIEKTKITFEEQITKKLSENTFTSKITF